MWDRNAPIAREQRKACKVQRVVFFFVWRLQRKGIRFRASITQRVLGLCLCRVHAKSASQIINGKLINLLAFAYTINLASREDVNGDTIFNVPIFKFGQLVPGWKEGVRTLAQVQNEKQVLSLTMKTAMPASCIRPAQVPNQAGYGQWICLGVEI